MIIIQEGLRKSVVKNYFLTGKLPKNVSVNISDGDYCFEDIDSDEPNIFCNLKDGYEELNIKQINEEEIKMKKYTLINQEGCTFDSVEATSFEKAREFFKGNYEGKFIIVCEEERRNIRL